jgi:hypothetical protein
MAQFPEGWDPEAPGSRFTRRPALAIASRPGGKSVHDVGSDTGDAQRVVVETIDEEFLRGDEALGEARILDGGRGRGAEGWVPVIEWMVNALGEGLVGAAASYAMLRAGRRFRELRTRLVDAHVDLLVSRGAAEVLAVEHVVRAGMEKEGALDVESVTEASFMGGGTPPEMNYVGADPWLVSLLNADRTRRYVVGVQPDGSVVGPLVLPLNELQAAYLPRRDDCL